eukprot:gene37204-50200_t
MGTMELSHTGRQRLRGAVPPGWTFGHKTGTGQDLGGRTAGYNDVGFLIAPDGKAYSIAVMIGDTPRPIPERQALMQAVVEAVVANHRAARKGAEMLRLAPSWRVSADRDQRRSGADRHCRARPGHQRNTFASPRLRVNRAWRSREAGASGSTDHG